MNLSVAEMFEKYQLPIVKETTYSPDMGKFLLLGDSITEKCFSLKEGGEPYSLGAELANLYSRRLSIDCSPWVFWIHH